MKVFIFFGIIVSTSFVESVLHQWSDFKLTHGKVYKNSLEERHRFTVFQNNLKHINEHNALHETGLVTYKKGVNKFADMTPEEFKQYMGLTALPTSLRRTNSDFKEADAVEVPDSIDYRKKNAVNPVRDQAECGCALALSSVGSLESINYLKTGNLLTLSARDLVDCSGSYGIYGCDGGYDFIKNVGIDTKNDYVDQCPSKFATDLKISGYANITSGSEKELKVAVGTRGPVTVTVDASEWQFYVSGIFSTNESYQVNHGVVVIGYGNEKDQDYWIVRNSWGKNWGEQGYIRIARNKNNQLGISDNACYPYL